MSSDDRTGRGRPGRPDRFADAPDELAEDSDDLRYEGPIYFEDEDDGCDSREGEGGGKVFLTAAVIGAVVVVLVGAALWLRRDGSESPAARQQPAVSSAATAIPRAAQPATDEAMLPSPEAGVTASRGAARPSTPTSAELPAAEHGAAQDRAEVAEREEAPSDVDRRPPAVAREARGAPEARPEPENAAFRQAPTGGQPVDRPEARAASSPSPVRSAHELIATGQLAAAARLGLARVRQAPVGGYSLQVVYACQEETVRNAFRAVPDDDLFLVAASARDQQVCYRLLWGAYDDRRAAEHAVASVPEYFRQGGQAPWPLALGRLSTP